MTDTLAALASALENAEPSEVERTSSMDPLAVDTSRTNAKGVPYAPNASRGHVIGLGLDTDGNAYFAVPTYEVIRLNPQYQRDNERMGELLQAAADGGLHDVAVRAGKEITGQKDGKAWSFRPRFVAEIRKAPVTIIEIDE